VTLPYVNSIWKTSETCVRALGRHLDIKAQDESQVMYLLRACRRHVYGTRSEEVRCNQLYISHESEEAGVVDAGNGLS